MPKGKKQCEKCGREAGPRTKICPKCDTRFIFRPKSRHQVKTNTLEDWRSLRRGQIIKAVQGYGPYHFNSDGDRISDGYNGLFRVSHLDKEGIGAYPFGRKHNGNSCHGGYCYLYMGTKRLCKIVDSHWVAPHKLELVKSE